MIASSGTNWPLILAAAICAATSASAADLGEQWQLFLGGRIIETRRGIELRLHEPRAAEVVLQRDRPYEDETLYDPVVIKDGARYRMWYRANFNAPPFYMAYAESTDGVRWTKPALGLVEVNGSTANNVIWAAKDASSPHVWSVFKDGKPGVPEDERYKALARVVVGGKNTSPVDGKIANDGLAALVSPDGLRWRLLDTGREQVLSDGAFDTHSVAMWDGARSQYAVYTRGFVKPPVDCDAAGQLSPFDRANVRIIRRATSKDFRTWSAIEAIDSGDDVCEQLYKSAAVPYYRRHDLILMFPKRFLPGRRIVHPANKYPGLSDILFMFSYDGLHFDRSFREAFVRPGPDAANWHERAIEVGPTLVPTGSGEMSLYMVEHYRLPTVRIRRLVSREDGFVSARAGAAGGELTTKPFTFAGERLLLNVATSAAGSVRVEMQDAAGAVLPGFAQADCEEIYGDAVARPVKWKRGADLRALAGQPVRLRFIITDADLYAFRFGT